MVLLLLYAILFFFVFKFMIGKMFKGIKNRELITKSLIFTGTTFIFVFLIFKLNQFRGRFEKFEQIETTPTTTEIAEPQNTTEITSTDLPTAIQEDNTQQLTENQVVEEVPSNTSATGDLIGSLSGEGDKGVYNTLLAETQPEVQDTLEKIPQPDIEESIDAKLLATRQQSDAELRAEYLDSNNILPQDMWFKPLSGAKDLVKGKSCMVPVTINTGRLQYAEYN